MTHSPSSKSMIVSTFSDETAASDAQAASRDLQEFLMELQDHLKKI